MAPLPEIEDTFRCCFNWSAGNYCNVIHIHAPASDPQSVFDAINAGVSANMWAPMANFLSIGSVDITPLGTSLATVQFATDGSSKWKGTVAAGESIPAVAAVVSFKTVNRGRRFRGRVFVGPVAEQACSFGSLDSTKRANLVTGWAAFGSSIIDDAMEHVVASYVGGHAFTVTNYSVREACGTMRRRQDRIAA